MSSIKREIFVSSNYFSADQVDAAIRVQLSAASNIRFLNPGDTSALQSVTVVNSAIARIGVEIIRESNEAILAVCSVSGRHTMTLSGQQREGRALRVEVFHDADEEEDDIAAYRRAFDVSVEEAQAMAENEFHLRCFLD